MKLTTARVRSLRAPGKYADGNGLILRVTEQGGRFWCYRYVAGAKDRMMTLGDADVLSLADARKLHTEARVMLAKGIDPLAAREAAKPKAVHSFADVAEAYVAAHRSGWRGRNSVYQWQHSLSYAIAAFGSKPVEQITTEHVLTLLSPLWTTKAVTATLVRSRVELVLDYAIGRGWRVGPNPAAWRGCLKPLLPAHAKVHTVAHHPALDWHEAPALMTALAAEDDMAARCLRFVILTAARSSEARLATWAEIDLAGRLWSLPAARMKAGRPHRVPLSDAACGLLEPLADLRSGALVFEGERAGRPVSDVTLKKLLRRLGHGDVTTHGMRACFRSWCSDTGQNAEAAEMALAHAPPTKLIGTYQRSDLLEPRRPVMQQWADYLTRDPAGVVVPLRRAG
jgi:integrase